jgi:hypothetical protein
MQSMEFGNKAYLVIDYEELLEIQDELIDLEIMSDLLKKHQKGSDARVDYLLRNIGGSINELTRILMLNDAIKDFKSIVGVTKPIEKKQG